MKLISAILICFISVNVTVHAQYEDMYELNWKEDGIIAAGTASLFLTDYFIERSIPIFTESEINAFDRDDVLFFDRSALNNESETAATISDICRDVSPFMPLALMLSDRARREAGHIGIMYLEAVAVSNAITTAFKVSVRRKRPYVYNPDVPLSRKQRPTASKSFFSGHTSLVASITFFSASVFSDYYPDSRYKPYVWAGAISISALTAYTRYSSGNHFPSDVIIGYAAGALIGYYIPKLHKLKKKKGLTITPIGSGVYVSKKF